LTNHLAVTSTSIEAGERERKEWREIRRRKGGKGKGTARGDVKGKEQET
jgi:hypothetical protein